MIYIREAAELTLRIETIGGALGAVVSGISFHATPTRRECSALNKAFLDHHMLCFRDQDLLPQQYLSLSRLFGDPQVQLLSDYHLDGAPEINVISNYNNMNDGKPHVRATYWHTDDSYFAIPAKATLLYAQAVPSSGGDTGFINCCAVLEAMPDALRRRIDGRHAVHKYLSRRGKAKVAVRTAEEQSETPDVHHPLVRTHPETGRPSIYINPNRIDHINAMGEADGDALLDDVYDFAFQEKFQYHHQWCPGDIVIWDNRCTMHRAHTDFDIAERREFLRILLKGTAPE